MAVGLTALAMSGFPVGSAHAGTRRRSPNILVVLTDDMTRADLHSMPGVQRALEREGMRFSRAMVNVSLCCPSRTTLLRGQYAHNTRVESNGGTNGGFEAAYRFGVERSTIATRLHRAGYRTALIGKYLNGFPNGAPSGYRPPGWTDFVTPIAGDPYGEFAYTLDVNGRGERHGVRPADYGTRVYLRHARDVVRAAAEADQPFFVELAVYAPHRPATPDPRDVGSRAGLALPRPPSFNEADVRDKPLWLQQVPPMTPGVIERSRELFERRRESLRAVDRGVVGLVDLLRRTKQLDHTYIVFTSDNGFHNGQHRLPAGKQTAFDEDIRVPLIVRGPGIARGSTNRALVGNVDLAPTFADLANRRPPPATDGRSLVALLLGHDRDWPRRSFLLEHWPEAGTVSRDARIPLEPPDNDTTDTPRPSRPPRHRGLVDPDRIPEYRAIRTKEYTYVEYMTGEHELYDLRRDPHQLVNVYPRLRRATRLALTAEVAKLADCSGASCRHADARVAVQLRYRRDR